MGERGGGGRDRGFPAPNARASPTPSPCSQTYSFDHGRSLTWPNRLHPSLTRSANQTNYLALPTPAWGISPESSGLHYKSRRLKKENLSRCAGWGYRTCSEQHSSTCFRLCGSTSRLRWPWSPAPRCQTMVQLAHFNSIEQPSSTRRCKRRHGLSLHFSARILLFHFSALNMFSCFI